MTRDPVRTWLLVMFLKDWVSQDTREPRERKAGFMNHEKVFSAPWIFLMYLELQCLWWPSMPPSWPSGPFGMVRGLAPASQLTDFSAVIPAVCMLRSQLPPSTSSLCTTASHLVTPFHLCLLQPFSTLKPERLSQSIHLIPISLGIKTSPYHGVQSPVWSVSHPLPALSGVTHGRS